MRVQVGSRYSAIGHHWWLAKTSKCSYGEGREGRGGGEKKEKKEKKRKQRTIERPVSPPHAAPLALAVAIEAGAGIQVDVEVAPLDVEAGVAEVHLDDAGVDVVADAAVGAEAVEEAEGRRWRWWGLLLIGGGGR